MNKMRDKIYNFLRLIALKKITNNLGKVVETEDKIICYVKKSKCKNERYQFTIPCKGYRKQNKDLAEAYGINKPICYVIENIEVKNKRVFIFGYDNVEVIIRNCTFLFDLYGHINGKCTLENSFVRAFSLFNFGANELTINNMNITNPFSISSALRIALGGEEKLEINNSTIGKTKQKTDVYLIAKDNMLINGSSIGGDKVEIKAKKVKGDDSSTIKASEQLKIDSEEYSELNVDSTNVKVNDKKISTDKTEYTLSVITDKTDLQRARLINTLRKIKENCEENKKILLELYELELDEQSIHKLSK